MQTLLVGLLSIAFSFTAGDHVIVIQPCADPSNGAVASSGRVNLFSAALCRFTNRTEQEAVILFPHRGVLAAFNH